jgi:hypothetical protein
MSVPQYLEYAQLDETYWDTDVRIFVFPYKMRIEAHTLWLEAETGLAIPAHGRYSANKKSVGFAPYLPQGPDALATGRCQWRKGSSISWFCAGEWRNRVVGLCQCHRPRTVCTGTFRRRQLLIAVGRANGTGSTGMQVPRQ